MQNIVDATGISESPPRQKPRSGRIEELWGLIDAQNGNWILALDCAGEPLLAYCSFDDATEGAKAHWENYQIDCIPRRFEM